MLKSFNIKKKPTPLKCPEEYCFYWGKKNLSEPEPHCTATECIRLNSDAHSDSYELDEPTLKQNSLPWFYFIPSPELIVEELKEKYIQESEKLWGKEHWKR